MKINIYFATILPALFCVVNLAAHPIGPVKGLDSTLMAVYIGDTWSKRPLVEYNTTKPLIPASITKAVTSAAVLDLCGPWATFTTGVVAEGDIDSDGCLHGNLVIQVSGDPTLGSVYFPDSSFVAMMTRECAAYGIKSVKGTVRVDTGERIDEPAPAGWMRSDLGETYGTLHRQATYADNCFTLSLPSGSCNPPVPDMKMRRVSKKGRLKVSRVETRNDVRVTGRYPRGGSRVRLPNSSPGLSLEAAVADSLRRSGIEVGRNEASVSRDAPRQLVYLHHSPSFGNILQSLMHRSDNMYAEGMLRVLSPWQSRKAALATERRIMATMGVDTIGVYIEDGSGLSRDNRITAQFMASLLDNMAMGSNSDEYVSLFPRVGMEGTVKRLLALSQLTGRLVLKSGSMKGVRCYAGYYLDDFGRPLRTVVVMVNGFAGSSADLRSAIERMLLDNLDDSLPAASAQHGHGHGYGHLFEPGWIPLAGQAAEFAL